MYIAIYIAAISFWAIGLTAYDKYAARKGLWRVKERTLLLVSLIGGSVAMLAAMRFIRHKTKRAKFMVGLPVMIGLQVAAVLFVFWWLEGGVL